MRGVRTRRTPSRFASRAALALLIAAGALSACGDGADEREAPPASTISDEEVLAKFVVAEQRLDADALTAALGAGADLGKAADGIRAAWDAARRRNLASLGPDGVVRGVIAFDIHLTLETRGTSAAGGTSSVTDKLTGRTVATVNDDAVLASVLTTGGYDHTSVAQGSGLTVASGQSSIHVDVSGTGATATGSGGATDAQVRQARAFGASLLQLAGSLAAARAGDYYETGYCTEILASPDDQPTEVALGATKPFDIRVRHKWDNAELTDRITSRLDGDVSVSPAGRVATPVTLTYVAPNEKNRKATIQVESRSRRGIARRDLTVKTPGGYAIHDTWTLRNGWEQKMDGVNCDSPYGPWHVVVSGDLAAAGWTRLDAYYDITADPNTGKGTVRGEEHSVTTERHTYDGTSTGTAEVVENGDNYLVKLEIDYDIIWDTPDDMEDLLGQDRITGHVSRELDVIPATGAECP